ncbi:MAG: AMP-binding protein [Burkholderiaceae bacterium]|jgi:long-chain acyl-CoA synthetase|nr:AMP-binding protein [Burkholderiaceae bacterium]
MNPTTDIDRLAQWAREQPDKAAVRLIDGEQVRSLSYAELDARSTQAAHWLIALGLRPGDGLALLMENRLDLFVLGWAARRAGLYYTPVSPHLHPSEVAYILNDCEARLLIGTQQTLELARRIQTGDETNGWDGLRYLLDGKAAGWRGVAEELECHPSDAILPQCPLGRDFLYSSGTTGKPKGIKRPLTPYAERMRDSYDAILWREYFGLGRESVYLTMAPLYHAAPLRTVMRNIEWGGASIVTRRFDALAALRIIADWRVTHSQWVPTMMIRMLALPQEVRQAADLSSTQVAIHAAAPCPPDVKRGMIEWWGPVWYEYYGGSESIGLTAIDSAQWLQKPGSVGRAMIGKIHIKDDQGNELPAGRQGHIYFSGTPRFEYHNDPAKTAAAYDAQGCATFGDIGHVDEDGFLFLSGRRTDLILSGGVNIYPQEVENLLATYPGVTDVAVIGVPHPEFGEEVRAVVELVNPADASPELAAALIDFCRQHLAHLKCPRSVDFVQRLPRSENGKLYKRRLMEQYAAAHQPV